MTTIKTRILKAENPESLADELDKFLKERATEYNVVFGNVDRSSDPRECQEIINVQQFIMQTVMQNRLAPNQQSITNSFYLLIIYK